MSKRFYLTTAIYYVNGRPHVGSAYEMIISDVIVRAQKSMGHDPFFLTGLDEHGQKVQQAALAEGKTPQAYCDELASSWLQFAQALNLSNNDFIRTSDQRHKAYVQAILTDLHSKGHFYKSTYKGFYSTSAETFLTEKDRFPDGSFDPAYGKVVELQEENYYFKLQQHQEWLITFIEANKDFIQPIHRRNEVLGFLKNNVLEDLCISRPASRLNWGIPLPFDPQYVTWVWFDALVNYISVPASEGDPAVSVPGFTSAKSEPTQSLWPADIHVIGKDILKFHAVYWPIMLKAMGFPLPKKLLVHGWWQKDGQKLSKSTGHVIDPLIVIRDWGLDALRYYVVRELSIGPDGNWTDAGFESRYSAELANGLGNLVNRSLSMLKKYRQGIVPVISRDLETDADQTVKNVREQFGEHNLQEGLVEIWKLITRANQYVDQTAPFKLAKDVTQSRRLNEVLYSLVETCRIISILIWPYLPQTARKIYAQLGLSEEPSRLQLACWGGMQPGAQIGEPQPLFPRKDLEAKK